MARKYLTSDAEVLIYRVLGDLNTLYGLDVKLTFDPTREFDDTIYNSKTDQIILGTKDIALSRSKDQTPYIPQKQLIEILQYVVHEFFHGEQTQRILNNLKQDPQLTADYFLAEIFYDFYYENHTLSLLEVDTERHSWKYLSENLPNLLNISQSRCDRLLCSIFASVKNEFFEYAKPNIIDKFFMQMPGASHADLDSFLQTLEIESRSSLRDAPGRLDDYFDFTNCEDVCDQVRVIANKIFSFPSTNPLILKARDTINVIQDVFPELLDTLRTPKEIIRKEKEPELGSGRLS